MTFTVTYREKNGAKAEVEIEAASRAECFAHCKARGIAPLGVKEGRAKRVGGKDGGRAGARPSRSSGGKPQSSILNLQSSIFLVAILAALASVAWWWLGRDESQPRPAVAEQKPTAAPATSKPPIPKAAADGKAPQKATGKKPAAKPLPASDADVGNPPPPAVSMAETNAPAAPPSPPPVFSNASDQVIAMALSPSEGGIPPIPLTPDMEKAFLKSLETEIVILDTDDDKVKAMKQAVIETRAEIKRLMDQGQTFAQIIREHQHLANENAKLRMDALIELKRIRDSGDIEGAMQYRKAINAALAQMGIKELSLPITEEERAERDAARLERLRQRKEAAAHAAEATATP